MATTHPISDENWLPVPGFPGYRVSDTGRVQSCKKTGACRDNTGWIVWRDLKPGKDRNGHLHVTLSRDGEVFVQGIHRLVLAAFVGPCPPGMEGCHWDDDPANNRVENLRWDTRSNNCKDAFRNGRRVTMPIGRLKGEAHPHCKISDAACDEIRRERAAGVPLKVLADRHGISKAHVCCIAKGKYRSKAA